MAIEITDANFEELVVISLLTLAISYKTACEQKVICRPSSRHLQAVE